MGVELPMLQIFINRLDEAKIHLAAYGSVAFAIALVIEGPIIQLLAASTALCGDEDSFRKVRRFMWVSAFWLTALHVLVAFTPIYDFVAGVLLDVPEAIHEPGRLGLQILTPWTAAIAYRRFHQGLLIRFERSRLVGIGTIVRVIALVGVLAIGSSLTHAGIVKIPGVAVGAAAVSAAVLAEALFIGWAVRATVRERLSGTPKPKNPLTRRVFFAFYFPLALTPLLTLIIQPTGSAAMSRMPDALNSLAAWPVVHSLVFLLRSAGFAYNEVVVSLLGRPGSVAALRKFAMLLAGITSSILFLLSATPFADFWLGSVSGLAPELIVFAKTGCLIAVLMPAYQALQSWYSGVLVHARVTRGITEAVALYVVIAVAGLLYGGYYSDITGLYFAIGVFVVGGINQTIWLAIRARPHLRAASAAEAAGCVPSPSKISGLTTRGGSSPTTSTKGGSTLDA
jgi:hypothetical protein